MWKPWAKLRARSGKIDDDLSEEIQSHLDLIASDRIAGGMNPDDARAAARREFGNATGVHERARDAWRFTSLDAALNDVRYALRAMRRAPAFSLAVLLTLGLGIGATTAIFSVVYAVLLRPLPYPSAERLVWLGEATPKAQGISVTWINFEHWRRENHSFEEMAGFQGGSGTMTGRGHAQQLHGMAVTSAFFRLTGWQPQAGRLFLESDDAPNAAPVVIVSHEFWRQTLGGGPNAIGASLVINGRACQIVGVLRSGQSYSSGATDFYMPLGPEAGRTTKRASHGSIRVLALLKPGVTLAAAKADLDGILERLASADPGPEDDHKAYAEFLADRRTGDVRLTLYMLMGAVLLVLLIACANSGSLLAVRNSLRAREIAIRAAIGAGRRRIARQLLTENLVMAALGGGLGVLLAYFCLRVIQHAGPRSIPRLAEAAIDVPVLIFAVLVTCASGLLAALAPLMGAGRLDLSRALKEGAPGSGSGRKRGKVRNALVVAEIATTLVLTFGAALLVRSLIAATRADPGFEPANLLALELNLPRSRYQSPESIWRFYGQLLEDVRNEPGITSAGAVYCPPLAGSCGDWWYSIADLPAPARTDVPLALTNIAGPSYLKTIQARMLAGRGFAESDRKGAPLVAIVNEELARRWWLAPQMAIGHHLKLGGPYQEGETVEIVGVVSNLSQAGLDQPAAPEVFFPFAQRAQSGMVVMVRTAGNASAFVPALRRHVSSLDPNIAIQSLRVFEERLGASLARRRFSTMLFGAFAALGIVLAAVGIYGVLNAWVSARQKEIAIRLAVGARGARILGWAGFHALRLALAGMALGATCAWAASRWLNSLVFGVSARDPAIFAAACGGILLLASAAAAGPLWKAMRVDAVRNLREG